MNFHPSILSCLLPQLTSPRLAVRKVRLTSTSFCCRSVAVTTAYCCLIALWLSQRTIMALGHLVMSCGNLVFIDLIEHLLTELGRNDNMSTTRTYIQCTAAISRQAGHRIGETSSRCVFDVCVLRI